MVSTTTPTGRSQNSAPSGNSPYANPYLHFNPYGSVSRSSLPCAFRVSSNPYPINPGFGSATISATLFGAANLLGSEGAYLNSREQAEQVHESVMQAKIDNRRRALEEYLIQRDTVPTPEEYRERNQKVELQRGLSEPPLTEIWSGKSLNDLLAHIQKLRTKGGLAAAVALEEDTLPHLNVTSGNHAGHIGLLKKDGRLTWPTALLNPNRKIERDQLAELLPQAIRQASNNRLEPATLKAITQAVEQLEKQLAADVADLTPSQYIEAKRFLNHLKGALTVLQQPDAANYFNGKYSAKGKSVAELVKHMTDTGLRFAPAAPGDEKAYHAVHKALALYVSGLQSQLTADR